MAQADELREAWGSWLTGLGGWDWWCTLTFRHEYTPDAADRAFERWAAWLRKDSPGLGYFVAHEVGGRGRLHLHALMGGLDELVSRRAAWKRWHEKHGRAQLLPYDPTKGAGHYIAKYVTKELGRYDIHPVSRHTPTEQKLWQHLAQQDSTSCSGRAGAPD